MTEPITYSELQAIKVGERITYLEKLNTSEWQEKRTEILNRDRNHCTQCNQPEQIVVGKGYRSMTLDEREVHWKKTKTELLEILKKQIGDHAELPPFVTEQKLAYPLIPIELHVHHKYYIDRKLPWEYSNSALTTLCHECHKKTHLEIEVPVYSDEARKMKITTTKCSMCDGSGYRPEYHYFENGVCFYCDGTSYIGLE